jgi:hypothetical protein
VKEHYIDDKVVILSKRLRIKSPIITRMNKERHLHAVCNRIHQELIKRLGKVEHETMDSVYRILRDELR